MKKTVSAIVPIYNEEKTLTKVVQTLLKSSLIDEVICVNDGSSDKSAQILQKFSGEIKLINLKKNHGKGYALACGIKKAKGKIVSFFDADLTTLSETHIKTLLRPVLENKFKGVVGYAKNGQLPSIFINLSGERAYYKNDLIPHLNQMSKTRFGVEIFLNDLFKKQKIKKVPLRNLQGLYKHQKRDNPIIAFKEYLNEAVEIAKEKAKRESLPAADYRTIELISRSVDLADLATRIKRIKNIRIKQFLKRYILRYLT